MERKMKEVIVLIIMIFVALILANVYTEHIPYRQTLKTSTLIKVPLTMLTKIGGVSDYDLLSAGYISSYYFQIPISDKSVCSEGIDVVEANGTIFYHFKVSDDVGYAGRLINGTVYNGEMYETWGYSKENLIDLQFSAYGLSYKNTYDIFPEHDELRFGRFSNITFIYCLLGITIFWLIYILAYHKENKPRAMKQNC